MLARMRAPRELLETLKLLIASTWYPELFLLALA